MPENVRQAVRLLTTKAPALSVRYELAAEWPTSNDSSWRSPSVATRFKRGMETFDFDRARQTPESASASPIVRDNLALLGRTGLTDARLLDFGCANALYRLILASQTVTENWEYVGADINAEIIEWCRTTHQGTRFEVVKDNRDLPFRDGEFDVVLTSGVVHCIADFAAVMSELHRVSRDYVLASRLPVWKHHPTRTVLQHVRHPWGEEMHPIHVFNRDELEATFARLRFSIVYRDYGSEIFDVPDVHEPAVHNHYLLRKI
ncbi:MAG TPA: class I SAM-dependent methyltransferase [Pyrinomonadaceae bacterium]